MAAAPAAAGGPMAVESRAAPDRQAGPVRSDAVRPASACLSRADASTPLRAASPCWTERPRRRPSHRLWPAAAPAAAAAPARPSGRAARAGRAAAAGRERPFAPAPPRLARLHRGRLAHGLQGRGFTRGCQIALRVRGRPWSGRRRRQGDHVGLEDGLDGRRQPARCARADPQRRAPSRSHRSGR